MNLLYHHNAPQDYNQNKEFKGNIGIKENNTYEESPIGLLSDTDWEYTIDDENNKLMLTYYKGTNPNVEIYPIYLKDNKKYKTIIKEGNIISGKTTSIFVKNANLSNNTNGIVENVKFMGNVEFENNSMQYLFEKCTSLKKIDISKIDFSNISNATRWLCDCSLIINQDQIKGFNNLAKLTNMTELFRSSYLQSLNLESWDISKVTNASYMFAYCSGLTNLILSNFNTSKVTNMDHMFLNCSSLKNLDVKSFNTKNVVCMCSLFEGCSLLTNLDLTNFNTSKVTDMRAMFSRCTSLKNLNLSSFDTSNVTIIYYIFDQCNSLENLDLSNFNTSKVQRFSLGKTIFSNMTSLKELHINNFSFDSINNESYGYLFSSSTPTDVHIYTNEAAKQYINEKHPTYTNITVV